MQASLAISADKHHLSRPVFALWAFALAVVCVRIAFKYPQHDCFITYFTAGQNWAASQPLYSGTRGFVYSPSAAVIFTIFAGIPAWLGAVLWRLLNAALFLSALFWWMKSGLTTWLPASIHWLVFLLALPLSIGNFNNGQVNPAITGLLVISVLAAHKQKWWVAALGIAVATFFKIYPLSIGLLLTLLYPRKLGWRLALCLIAMALLPFILRQSGYVIQQYQQWFSSRAADDRRMNMDIAPRDFAMLLQVGRLHLNHSLILLLQLLSAAAIAGLCVLGCIQRWSEERLLLAVLGLGSVWMLLFGPSTEDATYILIVPALIFTILRAFSQAAPSVVRVLLCASYGTLLAGLMINSFAHLKKTVYVMSVQPAGTLLFGIALLIILLRPSFWTETKLTRVEDSAMIRSQS